MLPIGSWRLHHNELFGFFSVGNGFIHRSQEWTGANCVDCDVVFSEFQRMARVNWTATFAGGIWRPVGQTTSRSVLAKLMMRPRFCFFMMGRTARVVIGCHPH